MKTYKLLVASFAIASMFAASIASAQVATSTSMSTVIGGGGPDLAVSIVSNGIMLDATHSSESISVMGLPFSIGNGIGGTCQLNNAGTAVGTVGTADTVTFSTAIVVPAGTTLTLPVTCSGAVPGTYSVSLVTSGIPAVITGTSQSITPRGMGGGADNDTTAVGSLTIGSGGTVTGITTPVVTTTPAATVTPSITGQVLGTSTSVPNVPNTGAGGAMGFNLAVLALAALAAVGGAAVLRRARA